MSDYTRADYDQDRADAHTEQMRALVEQRAEISPDTPWPADERDTAEYDEWATEVDGAMEPDDDA